MLWVRIDGHEVETTSASLAALVFDGKIDRDSKVRLPGETTEQPLERALGPGHAEALTVELHRRIRLLCAVDSSAVDVQELCTEVEHLCQWRWPSSPAMARFFWAAAWLNELLGRPKIALDFYDTFLLLPASEGHLRQLALNNRGVLLIQLGRLDGVEDLARAATGDPRAVEPEGPSNVEGGPESSRVGAKRGHSTFSSSAKPAPPLPGDKVECPHFAPNPLPRHDSVRNGAAPASMPGLSVACFNLLNLINVAYGSAELLGTIDAELTDFFGRLGPAARQWWLGDQEGGQPTENGGQRIEGGGPGTGPSFVLRRPSSILRDPTYRRPNMLVARLSAAARDLAADSRHPMDRPSSVFHRLSLWDCRIADQSAGPGSQFPDNRQLSTAHGDLSYAEAAALLLSDDVPSGLTRQDHPLARLEMSLREELLEIESHLAAGQYELARSRLLVQQQILGSLAARYGLAMLVRHVEAQIERVEHLQLQEEQLRFHQALSAWQSGVPWDQIERDVIQVLVRQPDQWLTLAPLFGWRAEEGVSSVEGSHGSSRPASDVPRSELRDCQTLDETSAWTVERAGHVLQKALEQIGADGQQCLRLWQCVETTLSPALAGRDVAALGAARTLAERCLDRWPAGLPEAPGRADPRHPVNRFLEACEKARRLAEAEQLLGARPPRLDEARQCLVGILQSGVSAREQLRRIVTGLYLAQFQEKDPPPVQRQVLADLDAWVARVPPEAVPQIEGRQIVAETEKARRTLGRAEAPGVEGLPGSFSVETLRGSLRPTSDVRRNELRNRPTLDDSVGNRPTRAD